MNAIVFPAHMESMGLVLSTSWTRKSISAWMRERGKGAWGPKARGWGRWIHVDDRAGAGQRPTLCYTHANLIKKRSKAATWTHFRGHYLFWQVSLSMRQYTISTLVEQEEKSVRYGTENTCGRGSFPWQIELVARTLLLIRRSSWNRRLQHRALAGPHERNWFVPQENQTHRFMTADRASWKKWMMTVREGEENRGLDQ